MPIETGVSKVQIGYVESNGNRLDMALDIRPDGTAALMLFMHDQSSRRTGEIIILGYYGATELRQLFNHAEATVQRMTAAGQIAGLMRDR